MLACHECHRPLGDSSMSLLRDGQHVILCGPCVVLYALERTPPVTVEELVGVLESLGVTRARPAREVEELGLWLA